MPGDEETEKRCSGSIPYGYKPIAERKQTLVVDPVARGKAHLSVCK